MSEEKTNKRYELHLHGRSLGELKKAVEDAYKELNGGAIEAASSLNNVQLDKTITEPVVETEYPNTSGLLVDSEGIPWDVRIHSSSKSVKADGTFTLKRGVDKTLVDQVKAELKGNVALAPAQPIAPTQIQQPIVAGPAQPIAPSPVLAPPVMNAGHTLATFTANFAHVMAVLVSEGKLTQDYVSQMCASFGVKNIVDVNDAGKATIFEHFATHGIIQKVG